MATTSQISWASGGGYITLTYTGEGNSAVQVASDVNDSFDAREQNVTVTTTKGSPTRTESILIKQGGKTIPVGTKYEFDYTGGVQEVTLPKGRYKLQVWGAQGGNVTGTYAVSGSKGGYSEGVLELTEPRTLYIFVGGQGSSYTSSASQTSTSVVNGGWNGGGAGLRTSRYKSGDTDGRSFPRGGGGATDIALVTSTMSYSSGRTTRSSESLSSRMIVAGGGAGASASYTAVTTTDETTTEWTSVTDSVPDLVSGVQYWYGGNVVTGYSAGDVISVEADKTGYIDCYVMALDGNTILARGKKITIPEGNVTRLNVNAYYYSEQGTVKITLYKHTSSTSTSSTFSKSQGAEQGGGVNGRGYLGAKQYSAGSGGDFGLGANQSSTNYRYCGGGGGGGWYGGGAGKSDNDDSYVYYSGGGSGFVNTAANASYRPSGYTGLQLESGTTTVGNTSHPSISGGTETGHSGNGYAIITKIS